MQAFMDQLYATYHYQWMVQINMMGQLLLSGFLFSFSLRRKRHFFGWLTLSVVICFVLMLCSVLLRSHISGLGTRFIMRFIQLSMPLVIDLLCFSNPFHAKLKTWCAGVAGMEIGAAAYSFLLAVCNIDERITISLINQEQPVNAADWIIYYALHLLVYWVLWRFAGPRKSTELDRVSRLSTIVLTLCCIVFLTIPDCISNEYRAESWPMLLVNRSYLLVVSIFILVLCNGIELQSHYRTEMLVMDQILLQERKQYQVVKENIDLINMRCHDLKHHLDDFSDKLTAEEITSLRDAMNIYDRNIKTGSEVLDLVIYVIQLACEKEQIEFSCLADGQALRFMKNSHVYSLFMNALSNALEAVRKLDDPSKRVISLTVQQANGFIDAEIVNYFDGQMEQEGQALQTTKRERGQHGYGTMSMRYLAEQYHGTMAIQHQRDVFSLTIHIPINS